MDAARQRPAVHLAPTGTVLTVDASPELAPVVTAGGVHPELRAVALFEALKGLASLVVAGALAITGPAQLLEWSSILLSRLRTGQPPAPSSWLQVAIDPGAVRLAMLVIAAYGLLRGLEAWGLWRARAWASWLGCVSAAIYLPFELHALARHPGWPAASVLAVNLLVVAVLGRDLLRRRR